MIDRRLFETTSKYAGAYFSGGASDETIHKYQEELGVTLSESYIKFLKEFGAGGVGYFSVSGIEKDDFSSMVIDTLEFRESKNLSAAYVVFAHQRIRDYDILLCLDTSRMNNGECPVVKYDLLTDTISDYRETFDDAFNERIMDVYNTRVVPRLAEKPETTEFPAGLGYKSCWLTVIGSNRDEILKSINAKNPVEMDYMEALEIIRGQPGRVMITADYDNRNYIMFYGGDFAFDEEFVKKKTHGLPEVYGYMTHRVSEAHGFFKTQDGEIQRLFYQDDDGIISVGEKLPEEKKNKINLPNTLEEARDKKKKRTRIDEKTILLLAKSSSEVEIGKYPYEPILLCDLV